MRLFPFASVVVLSGCIVGSLVVSQAQGENKIGLTSFEREAAQPHLAQEAARHRQCR